MYILGISGSTRVWGNCDSAVRSVLAAASGRAKCEFLRLTDFKVEPCRGCFKCIPEGGKCPIDDDLYKLLSHINSADALILAVPVYFMTPAVCFVGLLDRLLTMGNIPVREKRSAITITVMGNKNWRGVAEPIVNMAVSLLGFEISQSLAIEAQGPGEILLDETTVDRLKYLGNLLSRGEDLPAEERKGLCPLCRSDFFRLQDGRLICPICGSVIDRDQYQVDQAVVRLPSEVRWGQAWLKSHIGAWIKTSIREYKKRRRECLKAIRRLKEISDGGS